MKSAHVCKIFNCSKILIFNRYKNHISETPCRKCNDQYCSLSSCLLMYLSKTVRRKPNHKTNTRKKLLRTIDRLSRKHDCVPNNNVDRVQLIIYYFFRMFIGILCIYFTYKTYIMRPISLQFKLHVYRSRHSYDFKHFVKGCDLDRPCFVSACLCCLSWYGQTQT